MRPLDVTSSVYTAHLRLPSMANNKTDRNKLPALSQSIQVEKLPQLSVLDSIKERLEISPLKATLPKKHRKAMTVFDTYDGEDRESVF